ncbi:MAG TPA: hypothetical protein VGD50_01210 [Candidatus Baltobacteraceae bacterium]
MSQVIDVETISQVLLADGWHMVVDQSFRIDTCEYIRGSEPGEQAQSFSADTTLSFSFREFVPGSRERVTTTGPLLAVLALRSGTGGAGRTR